MHVPLALIGAAAHAQVLQRATEACLLMALEVVQGDDDIRIHNGPADFRLLHHRAPRHRHSYIIGALQAVGNDHMAAGGVGSKAV